MGLFDKLFGKKKAKEAQLDPKLQEKVEKFFEGKSAYKQSDLEANMYPITKLISDTSLALATQYGDPIISFQISPELDFCHVFGLDLGNNHHLLKQSDVDKMNISKEQIWQYAFNNLMKKVNDELEIHVEDYSEMGEGFTSFYSIKLDPNYLGSLLMVDDLMSDIAFRTLEMKGLVVAMPARNQLYMADVRNLKSIITMHQVTQLMYEASAKDGIEFSDNLYIRIDEHKWELFQPLVEGNYTKYAKIFDLTEEDLRKAHE